MKKLSFLLCTLAATFIHSESTAQETVFQIPSINELQNRIDSLPDKNAAFFLNFLKFAQSFGSKTSEPIIISPEEIPSLLTDFTNGVPADLLANKQYRDVVKEFERYMYEALLTPEQLAHVPQYAIVKQNHESKMRIPVRSHQELEERRLLLPAKSVAFIDHLKVADFLSSRRNLGITMIFKSPKAVTNYLDRYIESRWKKQEALYAESFDAMLTTPAGKELNIKDKQSYLAQHIAREKKSFYTEVAKHKRAIYDLFIDADSVKRIPEYNELSN